MKTYIATFKRHNIQLKKDYTVTRTIEAKTIASARKKAREMEYWKIGYSMELISVEMI